MPSIPPATIRSRHTPRPEDPDSTRPQPRVHSRRPFPAAPRQSSDHPRRHRSCCCSASSCTAKAQQPHTLRVRIRRRRQQRKRPPSPPIHRQAFNLIGRSPARHRRARRHQGSLSPVHPSSPSPSPPSPLRRPATAASTEVTPPTSTTTGIQRQPRKPRIFHHHLILTGRKPHHQKLALCLRSSPRSPDQSKPFAPAHRAPASAAPLASTTKPPIAPSTAVCAPRTPRHPGGTAPQPAGTSRLSSASNPSRQPAREHYKDTRCTLPWKLVTALRRNHGKINDSVHIPSQLRDSALQPYNIPAMHPQLNKGLAED